MLTEQPRLIKYSPLQTEQKAPPTRCDIHISFSSLCLCSVFLLALKVSVASLLFFLLFCALSLFLSLFLRTSTLSKHYHFWGSVWPNEQTVTTRYEFCYFIYSHIMSREHIMLQKKMFLKKKRKKKKALQMGQWSWFSCRWWPRFWEVVGLSGCPSAKTKVNTTPMTGHYQILPKVKPVLRVTQCLLTY